MKKNSLYRNFALTFTLLLLLGFLINILIKKLMAYDFDPPIHFLFAFNDIFKTLLPILAFLCISSSLILFFRKDFQNIKSIISMSISTFLLFFVLMYLSTEIFAPKNVSNGIITNYGLFEIPTRTYKDGSTKKLYSQRTLTKTTSSFAPLIDDEYGINYVIEGEPSGAPIKLTQITHYPEPGLLLDDKRVMADTSYFTTSLNKLSYSSFRFGDEKYLINGEWKFEFYIGNKLVLDNRFFVVIDNKEHI